MASTVINETTICNSALTKLGDKLILSPADDTKAANRCEARIDFARDIILTTSPWKFAIKREILASDVEVPKFEFDKQFTTPVDMLRLLTLTDSKGTPLEEFTDWNHEGGKILANETTLFLKYIRKVDDFIGFTHLAAEAVAFYLAWDISYTITQDKQIRKEIGEDFKLALRQARSVDAKEDSLKSLDATDWINSRVGPGGFDFSVFRFTTP